MQLAIWAASPANMPAILSACVRMHVCVTVHVFACVWVWVIAVNLFAVTQTPD